jgi:hypothetical protein
VKINFKRVEEKVTGGKDASNVLIAEATLVFEESPMLGMELAGVRLWGRPDGSVYITVPAAPTRNKDANGRTVWVEFLRSNWPKDSKEGRSQFRSFRDFVLSEFSRYKITSNAQFPNWVVTEEE